MEYNFTKDPCAVNRLKKEIEESAIVTALDVINLFGDALSIIFKTALSSGDETILNALVTAHTGAPLSEDVPLPVSVEQADPDTLGLSMTPKWAPQGWSQVYHEFEFRTSQLNAIHDKGVDGLDKGFTTAKFFNAAGTELTTQGALDTDCVRTEITFMPDHDYAIKSGMVAQITSPSEAVYLWALAPLSELGMADKVFCDGGINLEFVDSKNLVGLDGTAATMMPYMGGVGANRIRFIVRHSAGFKHRVQCILEYFKA